MRIDTVTINRHHTDQLPEGRAYDDDGPHIVVCNKEGMHFIARNELTTVQLAALNPTRADGIYYPEVAP